jgi:hypothetical protein
MRIRHVPLIIFSGLVWFAIGLFLLFKGLNFLVLAMKGEGETLWMGPLGAILGGKEQSSLFFISAALLIGFIKGRFVLVKSVKRIVARILSLPNPAPLIAVYTKGYFLLIGGMMGLGFMLKWVGLPLDVRGTLDVAIGSALMHGALLYFRNAASVHNSSTFKS